jgi:hypothetical protein
MSWLRRGALLRVLGEIIEQALARRGSGASNYLVYSFTFLN